MESHRPIGVIVVIAVMLVFSPVAALPMTPPIGGVADGMTEQGGDVSANSRGAGMSQPTATALQPVIPRNGSTAYLSFAAGETTTSVVTTTSLDAGGSVAITNAKLRSEFERLRLVSAFEAAETSAERRQVLNRALERLETRVTTLESRERQALTKYNRDDIEPQTYLRELATADAGADSLLPAIDQLHQYSLAVDNNPINTGEIAELKMSVVGLTGPVRERLKQAVSGKTSAERVYISTSDSGIVLSAIAGGAFDRQYVREAYLPGNRVVGATDEFFQNGQYQLERAQSRARELYPWTFENQLAFSVGSRTGAPFLYLAGVYSVSVDHQQGTARNGDLIAYIDGGTTDAFREVQYLSLEQVPTAPSQTSTSEGLLMQVNQTYVGGPLKVSVRDVETGDPVAATVNVQNETVGTTGQNGQLWTLTPNDTFTVLASTGDANVSVSISSPDNQITHLTMPGDSQ
jgi:hypothetical protein